MNQKATTSLDKTIGENIKRLRLVNGHTREWLAGQVGVTQQQFQKYEEGTNRIPAARLFYLSNLLCADMCEFVNENFRTTTTRASDRLTVSHMDEFQYLPDNVKKALHKLVQTVNENKKT